MWNVSTNQNGYQTGGGGDGMNTVRLVDRRGFLVDVFSAGALILGTRAFSPAARAAQASVENATWHPNVFVGINPDGTVVLVAHRSEMGTGIRTALPMVLADELDADWSRVRIEQAIGDAKYGSQNTDGSASIRDFYDSMREAGAMARFMLTQAAAQKWNVDATQCRAELHNIVHTPTGKKFGYGELATLAAEAA